MSARSLADHDGDHEAVDLEIRYLNRVKEGPVLATGEVVPGGFDGTCVRVPMTEPAPTAASCRSPRCSAARARVTGSPVGFAP